MAWTAEELVLNPAFVELIVFVIVAICTIAAARLLFRSKLAPERAPAPFSTPAAIGMAAPVQSAPSSVPEPAADPAINVPVPPAPPPPVAPQPSAPAVEQTEPQTSIPPAPGAVGDEHREEESHQPPEAGGQTDELEAFVDESIRITIAHNYRPTVFMWMRQEHGTQDAISRLVRFGDDQSGFKRLTELGLQDWSIEAAVLKFPDLFDQHDRAFAEFRLAQARRQYASTRGGNGSQGLDQAET